MPITQRTIVLNGFGLEKRERFKSVTVNTGVIQFDTMQSMGARFSVSVDATPMVHVYDAKTLGAGPAAALAEHLRERVQNIGVNASQATLLRREQARKALTAASERAKDKPSRESTQKRYSGGRLGAMPPDQSEKLFNDSGRFAKGIYAAATATGYTINFPANRFDPSTFDDGDAGVMRLFVKLRELVPEFGDAAQLATVPAFQRAVTAAKESIIARSSWRSSGQVIDLGEARRSRLEAVRAALELASAIAA